MITLNDIMKGSRSITTLEGTTEEILVQGILMMQYEMHSMIADMNEGIEEESIEAFLTHEINNLSGLIGLLNDDVVSKMWDKVEQMMKERLR